MATSYGMLTSFDSDAAFVGVDGQDVVYDAIQVMLARHSEELRQSMGAFVQKQTENHEERYYAPIGGEMQTLGQQAPAGAVKRTGYWDVGYPLVGIGDRLATDRVDAAYLTAGALESQIQSIMTRDKNSVRRDLLTAIFVDNARVFSDPIWGNITVQPLANGDAVIYPPIIGAAAGAIENHYWAAAALSAANFTTALRELTEHFGTTQGGENVAVFANPTDAATIMALGGGFNVLPRFVIPADAVTWGQTATPDIPGTNLGRYQGCWIQSWDWMPVNYIVFVHLDEDAPLGLRVDPAATGLGSGLQLIATESQYPITNAHYEHRYGFGARNRLNGVVWFLGAAYTPPANFNHFRYASS